MPDYEYGKGRVTESVQFISEEMREFENDYAAKSWQDYRDDKKLQKLMRKRGQRPFLRSNSIAR